MLVIIIVWDTLPETCILFTLPTDWAYESTIYLNIWRHMLSMLSLWLLHHHKINIKCNICQIKPLLWAWNLASENLALGKPTFQSSTGWRGDSSKAVDGDRTTAFGNGLCTHTVFAPTPWWAVDLQQQYLVHRVDLTNRAGQNSE